MTPEIRHRDAEETRANILKIAAREFAEKGLAGARIDEIAEKTATSKRMIYYYFGGKDGLYRAVLARSYEQIREREVEADFGHLPPADALRMHVIETFDYHAAHQEFVRLVMNENIHHGDHISQVEGLKDRNKSVISVLGTLIDRGVNEGVFASNIDPIDLHMSISALCFYNVSNRYTFANNFGIDMNDAKIRAKRREQVADIIVTWACAK